MGFPKYDPLEKTDEMWIPIRRKPDELDRLAELYSRYQYQSWYVKLWRSRWLFLIPYMTFHFKYYGWGNKFCLDLAVAWAKSKMKWIDEPKGHGKLSATKEEEVGLGEEEPRE